MQACCDCHSARLPETGIAPEDLLAALRANRSEPELEETLAAVSRESLAENPLSPRRFPSLARLEREAADIVLGLLHGTPGHGGLTSGGTESIFLAVYVARETARRRGIADPSIITAITADPAFANACHLLGIRQVRVPVRSDKRADVTAMASSIDESTARLVASAPNYPFGVIDPVSDVAALAAERGLLCHVDACLGGLLLPFWERLGEPVPPWDFRIPGVTSISADIHKYGYSYKGASTLLYRDLELYRTQWWSDDGAWGDCIYGGPTNAGTRPAPPIAGAWAALHSLGEDGYLRLTGEVRDARDAVVTAVDGIEELRLTVRPDLSVLEIGGNSLSMDAASFRRAAGAGTLIGGERQRDP